MPISNYPTEGMKEEARRGLAWRKEFGRGGTRIGQIRARQIVAGENLSDTTVKRMFSFLADKKVSKKQKDLDLVKKVIHPTVGLPGLYGW